VARKSGINQLREVERTSRKTLPVGQSTIIMPLDCTDSDWMSEEYWSLLMPKYEIGCKVWFSPPLRTNYILSLQNQRRVFDSCKYVSCLQRSNIHLTDDPITALRPRSIQTKSGREYPADSIVSNLITVYNDHHRFIAPTKTDILFVKQRSSLPGSP
jgi:hypothetical protein